MKVFTNDNNFKEINEKPFSLEKDIQSITETNMDKVFVHNVKGWFMKNFNKEYQINLKDNQET